MPDTKLKTLSKKIFLDNRVRTSVLMGVVIMPLAAVLVFLFLGKQSLWLDEAWSANLVRFPIWHVVTKGEANMWLYHILLHFWSYLGSSEFVLRSLSAIFALATVPLIYLTGTRLFGTRVGIVAALLLTLNAFFISYAQEARSYSLVTLLVTASSFFFLRSIEQSSKRDWAGYVITSVLSVHAHLFAALVLIAHAVSLMALDRQRIPWKAFIISELSIFILLCPLAALMIIQSSEGKLYWLTFELALAFIPFFFYSIVGGAHLSGVEFFAWVSKAPWHNSILLFQHFYQHNPLSAIGVILLLPTYSAISVVSLKHAVKTGLHCGLSDNTWRYAFLLTWLFVPIVITIIVTLFFTPIFVFRYLIVCLPAFILLASSGIYQIRRRWLFRLCLTVLIFSSATQLLYRFTTYQKENWRGTVGYIVEKAKPDDAVVLQCSVFLNSFKYYWNTSEVDKNIHLVKKAIPWIDCLGRNGHEPQRIWVVFYYCSEKQGQMLVQKLIQNDYKIKEKRIFPYAEHDLGPFTRFSIRIWLYERASPI